jgi:hypothetical protein
MRVRLYLHALLAVAALVVFIGLPTRWSLEIVGSLVGAGLILRRLRNLLSSVTFLPHRPRLLVVEQRGNLRDGCGWRRPHWADCHFTVHRAWSASERDDYAVTRLQMVMDKLNESPERETLSSLTSGAPRESP